jgi:hypothetical protein
MTMKMRQTCIFHGHWFIWYVRIIISWYKTESYLHQVLVYSLHHLLLLHTLILLFARSFLSPWLSSVNIEIDYRSPRIPSVHVDIDGDFALQPSIVSVKVNRTKWFSLLTYMSLSGAAKAMSTSPLSPPLDPVMVIVSTTSSLSTSLPCEMLVFRVVINSCQLTCIINRVVDSFPISLLILDDLTTQWIARYLDWRVADIFLGSRRKWIVGFGNVDHGVLSQSTICHGMSCFSW